MKIWYSLMVGALLAFNLNLSAAAPCEDIAVRKDLPVDVKNRLLKSCRLSTVTNSCESKAKAKKLEGPEKDQFIRKCASGR